MSREYHVRVRGRTMGPFSTERLHELRDSGQVQDFDEISSDNKRTWNAYGIVFPVGGKKPQTQDPPPSQFKGHRPPPKSNRTLKIVVATVAFLVLGAGIAVAVILLQGRKPEDTSKSSPGKLPEGVITFTGGHSADERYRVYSQSVCLVIFGVTAHTKDTNDILDYPKVVASGFCVSESGQIITSKRVVEKYIAYDGSPVQRKEMEDLNLRRSEAKLWVFFGRDDKHSVLSATVSENFDMAVIKIDRKAPYRFAICESADTAFPLLDDVSVVGYPLADREAQAARFGPEPRDLVAGKRIQAFYREVDFKLSFEKGNMKRLPFRGRDPEKKELEAGYISYAVGTSRIAQGNWGGPLLARDGTVIGINTLDPSSPEKIVEVQNFALTMPQLRKELDQKVPNLTWRDTPR